MDLSTLPPLQGQGLSSARSSVEIKGSSFGLGDLSGLSYGLLSGRDDFMQSEAVVFAENDAEEAVKCLRRAFQVLNPGNHIAKRCPEHGSISFVHCKHATTVGKRYLRLRQIMEEKARVELLRDCVYRIKSLTSFTKDLQEVVMEEHRTLYNVTHDCIQEIPVSKIYCLNALCEDLRTHIGHWNCIKQKLHTNRWLQPILGSLYFELDWVKHCLNQLCDKAVWWLEKLILVGLQVFAHGNVETVTHEMIWNITRGLEDFNNIVVGLPNSSYAASSRTWTGSINRLKSHGSNLIDVQYTNSYANIGENVKAISFTRVLNMLANERCKYAALETHRFFTTNEEFVKLLHSGRLPNYVWSEESVLSSFDKQDNETSDYHTATGSMTSLSAAVLKIGNIRAPDLSNSNSPLVELSRREHTFAENFLLIVCNSTNLLRRKESQKPRKAVRLTQSMSQASKPPRGDTPVLSRNDSLRKSVSWGDSADTSIRSQLTTRYMDLYWSHFGTNFYNMFYEPCWTRQNSLYFSELGSVLLHNTTVMALVKHMVQHVCLKVLQQVDRPAESSDSSSQPDLFPSGSVTPMISAAKRCMHTAAFGAWDTYMCESLASKTTDKCYPCPLVNGNYCTRTGIVLRDTYQPMLNLLREQLADSVDKITKGALMPVGHSVAIASRLIVTLDLAHEWCQSKSHQFLVSSSISNFLLISQTDLKILVDESQNAVYQIQMLDKSTSTKTSTDSDPLGTSLTNQIKQLNVVSDNLQSLPASCMKQFSAQNLKDAYDYFKSNMPLGKHWRKKSEQDSPKGHNLYIENALETILEPVLEGVGKLKQTVQLSVISLAMEALCQAWMSLILSEKLKFSYAGACQFGEDVKFMRTWLQQNISNGEVCLSILDLPVLKSLGGGALLLMRQPSKQRSSSRFREASREDSYSSIMKTWLQQNISNGEVCLSILDLPVLKSLGGAALLLMRQPSKQRSSSRFREASREDSVDSMSENQIQGERSIHESEDYINHVGNPQDWLALRVSGPARGWRGISSCLNPDPE